MATLKKYKQNLRVENEKVFSYSTHVANIDFQKKEITCLGWWSVTTQKHINYVGSVYGFTVLKSK